MNSPRTRRLLTTMSLLGVTALVVTACGGDGAAGGADAGADGKVSVVASTDVWGSVVSAVGGDRVEVKSLIDAAAGDPHSYEATAEDVADVQSADLVLYNGGGYDDFFSKLAEQASGVPAIVAVEAAGHEAAGEGGHAEEPAHAEESHAEESHTEEGHAEEGHAEESHAEEDPHGHGHGGANEHIWYDLPAVAEVAEAVADRLGELDSGGAQQFTANAEDFTQRIDDLRAEVERIGTEHPGAQVIATEPVAHYLMEAAGLEDVTPPEFSEAIEEETDVPVAAQDAVRRLVEGGQLAAVINNEQTATPVTENLVTTARDAGVPVVNVTETLPEGETSYIAWMTGQVNALSEAVGS
ncbi:zinc/manganese transport system substrate-binding protein [Prauserella shujinwangii]|uniref:Zinc/manganese transport system substrate-binding protein n=1 Tax=Prauserella shujinwangii TaxID=1453103 RepID=A0A2T0M1L0_9PSEU|nr:zinc ABC transporter substrate-binding protein [Prauserella shujinwangii]PRX50494.1 zinc/manganese transport system substrate-binding protein [Prauserella shujinwangii]